METDASFYQLIKDITTIILLPVLIFVLRVGYSVNRTLQELVYTMYGPKGNNGVYGTVKDLVDDRDDHARRLYVLETAHRTQEHGN